VNLARRRAAGDAAATSGLEALAAEFPGNEEVARAAAVPERAPRPVRRSGPDAATEAARGLHRACRLEEAAAQLQRTPGEAAERLLARAAVLRRARRILQRLEAAPIPLLEAALAADADLGGCERLRRELGARLAAALEGAGAAALAADDLESAYLHHRRARALGGDASEEVLARLREKARELYLAAYVVRESDPAAAASRLRTALSITGPGDEVHRKARGLLQRLEGGGAGGPSPID
jgi:hypothetical protein